MAYKTKFLYYATQAKFDTDLANGLIDSKSIVFIQDTKRIWTHGNFFDTLWNYIGGKPATFAPSAHTLDSHSNVTITSNTAGEILKWDGSKWINNTLSEAGIAAASHNHSGVYQPLDADLTSIAGLADASTGFLKKTAANTWALDNTNYLPLTGGTLIGDLNTASGTITTTGINNRLGTSLASLPALGASGNVFSIGPANYGIKLNVLTTGDGYIQIGRLDGTNAAYNLFLQPQGGNIAIGSTTSPSYKLDVSGTGRFTGNVTAPSFIGSLSGNASTATKTLATVTGTNSTELVRGNMADTDQFRILVGGTSTNAGYVEIATADDGTEPIYVRQYTGVFANLVRTATLLDSSGNTTFPGSVTATSFLGNASAATALTTNAGSNTNPIYFSGGKPTASSYSFGNASGNIPISNGTLNSNLNADLLDGLNSTDFVRIDSGNVSLSGFGGLTYPKPNFVYRYLGYTADTKASLILFARQYAGTVLNKEGFIGSIHFSRGSTRTYNITNNINISIATGYITTLFNINGDYSGCKIITTTYNSEVYYGLYIPSSSTKSIYLSGWLYTEPIFIADASSYATTDVTSSGQNFYINNVEAATINSNVASATKLQTPRTIWGQSFDGSGNVSGALTSVTDITAAGTIQSQYGKFTNLTTNYLPKQTSSGLGNSIIYDDGTNVGIGTSSPSKRLVISHGEWAKQLLILRSGGNPSIQMSDGTTEITALGFNSGNVFILGTDKFNVNSSGNIGIGTTSPSYKLDVSGTGRFTGNLTAPTFIGALSGNANSASKLLNITGISDTNTTSNDATPFALYAQINTDAVNLFPVIHNANAILNVFTHPNYAHQLGFSGNGMIYHRLKNAGTFTGWRSLSFSDGTGASGTWNIDITGSAANATSSQYLISSGSSIVSSPGAGRVKYDYGIQSGTAGLFPISDNSNAVLSLNRHSGNYDSQLGFSSNGNIYYRYFTYAALDTTTPWRLIYHSGNFNPSNYLPLTGGTVSGSITASAFYQSSDEKLKDIISSIDISIKDIENIPSFYFKFKDDKENRIEIGTSAQKVKKVFPELVIEDKKTGYLSVQYDKFGLIALELIKKQQIEIDNLRNEINILKNGYRN